MWLLAERNPERRELLSEHELAYAEQFDRRSLITHQSEAQVPSTGSAKHARGGGFTAVGYRCAPLRMVGILLNQARTAATVPGQMMQEGLLARLGICAV